MPSHEVDSALAKAGAELVTSLSTIAEDQWFDRKSGRIAAKDLARPLIAFANAEGGTIVVGINNAAVDGVSTELENSIRQAPIDFTVPPVRARFDARDVEGKRILIVRVEPSDTVHTNQAGDCFLRIGDESRKLNLAEQTELTYDRGGGPFEATVAQISVADLDQQQLEAYRTTIGSSSVQEMLAARDLVNRRSELTIAAELLFDERPQRDFPSAYVRVLRYDGDTREVGARMNLLHDSRIEGSIPEQINNAAAEIERLVPRHKRLVASGRFEPVPIIPRDAWLEGLVNAVVHRSYSTMGDHIRVDIFDHRIEISSPGRFPGLVDPSKPLAISRYARNPRIARVCADLGITRELGEGIKRIFEEMKMRGLTDPIYRQSSSSVTLTLSGTPATNPDALKSLTKSAHTVLEAMRLAGKPLSTGQVAELAGIARATAGRALQSLVEAGLVQWHGVSPQDPNATWRLL
ncbi:ATP-binding protein [Buchananella felis]|uniref:ATP-binding protein n=1 Tax=Buchananella felis TaxID=3231492 RepID=UPI0035287844